jgi:hypothetical protein
MDIMHPEKKTADLYPATKRTLSEIRNSLHKMINNLTRVEQLKKRNMVCFDRMN